MNTPHLISSQEQQLPNFAGRPRRISLNQITAVKGCGKVTIRPITLGDERAMVIFHLNTSPESIYLRYFEYLGLDQRTSHERLVRICSNTPESYAVVMESEAGNQSAILAVGRLTKTAEPYVATFDMLIRDEEKAPQVGKALLHRLIKLAAAFGFQILMGELLVADHTTLNLCRAKGFLLQTIAEDGVVRVTLSL
jgi:acetyltransferase